MADHDAIVIGGGHNGLIAAAYLARAGLDTVLLEARATVGGCASTVDDLGARFNICNCDHTAIRSTPVPDELDLASHGLTYLDVEPALINTMWSGDTPWAVFHDPERTMEFLELTHPGEVAGYRRYVEAARPVVDLMIELACVVPTATNVSRRILDRRGRGLATLLRWSRRTACQVLGDFFGAEAMIAPAIATGPMVWGITGDTPGTGLAAMSYAMRHAVQVGRPVGGSGALPSAVMASFSAAGGTVRTDARVVAVHCSDDHVEAVELHDGDVVEAPIVVSACDPRQTFVKWLRQAPSGAGPVIERWQHRPEPDGFESKIDAVIGDLPRLRALEHRAFEEFDVDTRVPTTVVAPSLGDIALAHTAAGNGEIVDEPLFLVNTPTVLDPVLRPRADEHVLSLEVLYTPYDLAGGWDDSSEPQRWLDTFSRLAQPGWSDSIRAWRAMTPPVYERDFHLRRGHAASFSGSPLSALRGKSPELTRYRTPVKGLYLTGASTYPGAGVWGASGRNTAAVALTDLR